MDDPALAEPARHGAGRSAGDDPAVASRGLESFLALEIPQAGRAPKIDRGLRDLIQRMSKENPLWGASRIHGELAREWCVRTADLSERMFGRIGRRTPTTGEGK